MKIKIETAAKNNNKRTESSSIKTESGWVQVSPSRRVAKFKRDQFEIEIEEHRSPIDGVHYYLYVEDIEADKILANGQEFGSAQAALDRVAEIQEESIIKPGDIDNAATFLDKLESEIKQEVKKFMMSPRCGFLEDEVEDYSNVSTDINDDHVKISIGAELSFGSISALCDALNPIIAKYDKDAYFEPECPGRIVAYLFGVKTQKESVELTEAIDLGNDGSSDDSYTHYTFTFNGQRYSFQECHDNYKVAYHRNKDFINGIYPYDDADHPWAYSNHNDTRWKIVKAGKTVDTIDSDDLQPVLQLLQKYDKDVEPRIIHN